MNCSNDNSQQSKESWGALQQPCFWLKSNDLMFSRDEHLFCSFHEFHMILVLRIFERQNFINGFTIMAKQQKQMNITTSLGEVKEFWPQILLFYQTWQVNESFAIMIMLWTFSSLTYFGLLVPSKNSRHCFHLANIS